MARFGQEVDRTLISENERVKLLAEREKIMAAILVLNSTALRNSTQSAKIGRLEDLTKLAKKIKLINKKLGHVE